MEKQEKPFGVEVIAALSLLGGVYMLIYGAHNPSTLFQAGLGLLCALGLWLGLAWGWWAAVLRSVVIIALSGVAISREPGVVGFWAQSFTSLILLVYLLLPGVRRAFNIGFSIGRR